LPAGGATPSVRRAVRRAQKAGVEVTRHHGLDAVRHFYRLHGITRKRHGLPPPPFGFFRRLHEHVLSEGLGFVALARIGGRPVAAAVFVHFGVKAVLKYAASDRRYQQFRPNNLLLWEAIRWCVADGVLALSLGRTHPDNSGLRRFKSGWGARETNLEYFRYDVRSRAFVAPPDGSRGWHKPVFRHMPGILGRMAGSLLYRHMA
jgi:hypothetical protein